MPIRAQAGRLPTDGAQERLDVRVYSRRGADFTKRFPHLIETARRLRATSALLYGEGNVYDRPRHAGFSLIHSKENHREVSLVAFVPLPEPSR